MSIDFSLERKIPTSVYEKGYYPPEFNDDFKAYIRRRDRNRCAICKVKKRPSDPELDVHHVFFRKETYEAACISLCRKCHTILHKQRKYRRSWIDSLSRLSYYREGHLQISVQDRKSLAKAMLDAIREGPHED